MKATFDDFLNASSVYGNYRNNQVAKDIFFLLNTDRNILLAIEYCAKGLPPLCATVLETNKFTERSIHTYIGGMITVILKPFGFARTNRQLDTPHSVHFKSESLYEWHTHQ